MLDTDQIGAESRSPAAGAFQPGDLAAGRLPGPGAAWRIAAGYVDLFAVPRDDATSERPTTERRRHHLLRANRGDVLLGLPEAGLALVAVGSLGCAVSPVATLALLDGAAGPDGVSIEAWCRNLAEILPDAGALAGWFPAAEARSLHAGQTLQGDPARVLWVAACPGDLASPSGPVLAPLVALPPRSWIRAERATVVRIMRLAEACDHDRAAFVAALDAFHRAMLARAAGATRAAEVALAESVQSRRQEDAAALSAGLHRLAQGAADEAAPLRAGEDPAVAVCRMAGAACGVEMLRIAVPERASVEGSTAPEPAIERVERIAAASQLRCRRVLLTAGWWRRDRGVMIGFAQSAEADAPAGSGSPCLLLPSRGTYRRVDPRGGAEQAIDAGSAPGLWVEALHVYRVLPDRPVGLRRIFAFALRGVGGDAGAFLMMAVVTGLLTLLPPLAAGLLFDTIIPRAEAGRVLEVAGALVVLALSGLCFELVKAAALVRIEGRLSLFAQAALIERLLRLPARFFADYASGDLANRLLGIEEIRRTLTSTTVITLLTGVLSVFSLGLIFVLDPVLAALCAVMLALALAAALALNISALHAERAGLLVRGRQEGLVVQIVIGIAKLRVAAAEGRAMRIWLDGLTRQQASAARVLTMRTWLQVLAAVLPVVGLATLFAGVTLVGGTTLLASGSRLPLGTFMAFIAALGNLLAAVLTIAVQLTGALRSIPLYERARPLLSTPAEPRGAGRIAALRGGIEFCDVTFRYDPHGLPVLDRLSFRIAPQEYVAIVGASGSGKSTLMRLLLGFEAPEDGVILYDGTSQDQFDPASLRRMMGVVLQQSRLSPGNVFQNIVGNSGLSLDEAWAAARLAGFAADIEALPMGMHTTVLEGGQGLSGGQRQRLMIARALVARPRILLLDEATSALDNRTQDVVAAALAGLPSTRVVIAHRLSTIERADRVLVLERGRLVQSGSYAELLRTDGPFANQAARQLLA